jgi:hypothetical protein
MAKFVLTDAYLSVNSVDLSNRVAQVGIDYDAAEVDTTTMGAGSLEFLNGLKTWAFDVEFKQDFAAGSVDATLWSLVGGAAVTVEIRPTSAARSATNPGFNGSALVKNYKPLDGSIGDAAKASVTLKGTGALARSTS